MSLNGLFGIFDYLIYLVQSTNRHGVHSPFVYSFADKVLYGKQHCLYEPAAELCRKRMIQSKKGSCLMVKTNHWVLLFSEMFHRQNTIECCFDGFNISNWGITLLNLAARWEYCLCIYRGAILR